MSFLEFLKNNHIFFDGGMGTLLQAKGLQAGQLPERWNISHPQIIQEIHRDYYNAGSNVVTTNTFGANALKFSDEELESIVKAAIENVRIAQEQSAGAQPKFIALDIGPSGKMLKPLGDLDFEDAVELFAKTIRLGAKYGVDLILIETMNDCYETKAALLAAKENSNLPVIVSNAYGEDGKLMTGATPQAMVAMLEGMGADAIGANCSLGPKQLSSVVEQLLDYASVPVLMQANAGLPKLEGDTTVFDVKEKDFAEETAALMQKGLRMAGGCCGTTPAYIQELVKTAENIDIKPISEKNKTVISSYTHAVEFGSDPILIGERINPTGKKRFKQALVEGDIDYILGEGVTQQEKGVHLLDVNVGLPEIDEPAMLCSVVCELQAVSNLPLQIDTADPNAMEQALRCYNGKALINSVNGKKESMDSIFPLVKKYGGAVIALTLDEQGIPATAEGRLAIAKKILETAATYGIDKKDLIFDPLAMTVSADQNAAKVTLEAVRRIRTELGCHTSLGVSNVSFGLPNRDVINGVFFGMALQNGLSAAIMNPYSAEMMKTYYAWRALSGLDDNCVDYIASAEQWNPTVAVVVAPAQAKEEPRPALQQAIIKGLKEKAALLTKELLLSAAPLELVNNEIIPALNIVGEGFEKKTVYLPQLLMSAEAAKAAFEEIKSFMAGDETAAKKGPIILATVQGDIHDIGKNIVKLLLENYGFNVVDLGKDVPPQAVVDGAIKHQAKIVGLSALMTTTVPAMEETIRLLKEQAPWCKTIVGGAVLTKEYAQKMGADFYAKDAMEAVRFSEDVIKEKK